MKKTLPLALLSVTLAGPLIAQETLNIYNWSDYIAEDTITKFEAATGIKVTYDVYDSNEVLEAKLLAGSSGYDIVVPTSNFLQRQVKAGIYKTLDKAKIPNLKNLDPGLMKSAAAYDEGNAHSAIYLWGTTGIGYNIDAITQRLGDAAPTDSWSLVMDPANAAKLADCGITILDSAVEVMPGVLAWLGLPPDSTKPEDIEKAMAALTAIRPYVRYFHSSQYISDLANGEVCLSIGWSGDVFIAMDRATEVANGVNIGYTIPSEGTLQWFDLLAIPADAPHPDAAYKFINFVLQPEIMADITNYVFYPNAVPDSKQLIDPEITGDPSIYPPQEVLDKLFPATVYDARIDRLINRMWTQVRTGQ